MPDMSEIDEIIAKVSPYYAARKKAGKSGREISNLFHRLVYDSPSEALEPVYFWILDYLDRRNYKFQKLIDNFASSPGSGHFSELGMKKSQMQEQASKIMATINSVLRSVLNLIYDLKEFKIRLGSYDAANSKNKATAEAGLLSLKQIWMDKVDMQRGQGSINALSSGNLQFVTLRDAFLTAKSPADVDKLDLNDRVKRLLKPRVQEFLEWRKRSEAELRKRFEVEKTYLKSQVDALKLQARWAKPYLKAAERLEQAENLEKNEALVTAFNTSLLQLALLAKKKINVEGGAAYSFQGGRTLPEEFKKNKKIRDFYQVIIVDFNFIGIPSKAGQHYVFGGKATVDFKSYSLNKDELDLIEHELEKSYLKDVFNLVQGMTDDSLNQLNLDLDEFLEVKEKEGEKIDTNPFSALFGGFKPVKKEEKSGDEKKKEHIKKISKKGMAKADSWAEAYVRNFAITEAMDAGFDVYDKYKKNHGMASVPYGGEKGELEGVSPPQSSIDRVFGFK